jgi:stage III sporulation protein AB
MGLVGALLLISGGTLWGWAEAWRRERRLSALRDWQSALAVLATEIGYGLRPLSDSFRRAALLGGPSSRALRRAAEELGRGEGKPVAEIWEKTLEGEDLYWEEREILLSLGPVLGTSPGEDQIRHLHLARERLGSLQTRLEDRLHREARLYRYLGFLGGSALALLLW